MAKRLRLHQFGRKAIRRQDRQDQQDQQDQQAKRSYLPNCPKTTAGRNAENNCGHRAESPKAEQQPNGGRGGKLRAFGTAAATYRAPTVKRSIMQQRIQNSAMTYSSKSGPVTPGRFQLVEHKPPERIATNDEKIRARVVGSNHEYCSGGHAGRLSKRRNHLCAIT